MIWLIVIVAFVLRITNLNQGLWLDEAISALASRDYTYLGIIKDFLPGDTHPPLYYLSLKFWTGLFGFSEISMRTLSVIFGVATVYLVFLIGKKIKNEKLGMVASLLLATSPLHLYYSQEVRMYAMTTLAVSLSFYVYLYVIDNPKNKYWVLFSLSLLLIGLADYLPLLIIPVYWIYALIKRKRKEWWKKLLLAHLPLLFFALVWAPIFYQQSLGSRATLLSFPEWGVLLGGASIKQLVLVWVKFILGRVSFSPEVVYGAIVLLASTPFIYLIYRSLLRKEKFFLFWLWYILPLGTSFLGSFFVPGFSYFRLLFVLPALYLLVAVGVINVKLKKVWISIVVVLGLIFSLVYVKVESFLREDWKSAVAFVEGKASSSSAILMVFPEPFAPYRWYSQRPEIAVGVKEFGDGKKEVESKLKTILAKKDTLFTFDYLMDVTDPERYVFQVLEDFAYEEREIDNFRGIGQVRYWERN